MTTRPWLGTAIALALPFGVVIPLDAAVQTPCPNGRATGVYHAYSECQTNRAGQRVWFVVTDAYYSCPPAGAIVAYRIDEIETAQPCDQPAPQQNGVVRELGPGDQSPQEDGEFIFMECINGFWHRAYYLRHRLPDGSIRISRPAKRLENTRILCDEPAPPLVAGATRAPTTTSTAQAPKSRQVGVLTGIVLASRQDREQRSTMLVATPSAYGTQLVDRVRIELPEKFASKAKAKKLPTGWSMGRDGGTLVFDGPASADGKPLTLEVDLGGQPAPAEAKVDVSCQGKNVYKGTQKVQSLKPVGTPQTPRQAMSLPPAVSAGQEVSFQLLDRGLPEWGSWSISGVDAFRVADVEPPTYSFSVPHDWAIGLTLSVGFRDLWGEELVRGETETTMIGRPQAVPPTPRITDATPRILTGGSLCVCGWFPTLEARSGILLNGTPLGEPSSSSPEVLVFFLDPETPPGACDLVGSPEAGFGPTDRARTTLVGVGGSIDRNTLLRGESTPLQLQILGTEEPLTLRLTNKTPGIISIDGGVEQDVTTSGGADNKVIRSVRGLVPGDFNIVYELEGSECPCPEGSLPRAGGGLAKTAQ